MDPQSVTVLALAMLAVAGFTVGITGIIQFRRSRTPDEPASQDDAQEPEGDDG